MKQNILALCLTSLLLVAPSYADSTTPPTTATSQNPAYPDFSAIYASVGKSVVNINVTQEVSPQTNPMFGGSGDPMFDFFFKRMLPPQPQKYKQRSLGSGFIISTDGYILTNAHVVKDADSVTVRLNDKREFKAKIIGIDPTTDVAVVKIEARDLPTVKVGNPNRLKPGNWVVAIGSPFALENTITQGIVSALSRSLPDDSSIPFIQTDVPVNPGNSGGPLINLQGEVVGVNSQIYSNSGGYMGISFAIPIDYAMRIASQIKVSGKVVHGRLGIAIQPLTDQLAASFGLAAAKGALVNGVDAGSAADKAGIKVGDVILQINGQEVIDTAILPQIVSNLGPDKAVTLTIWRNNKSQTITATTQAAPTNDDNFSTPGMNNQPKNQRIDKLGIVVSQLSQTQLKQLGNKIAGGLIIQNVTTDAQFAGVASGDIIVGIANTPITSLEQFSKLVNHYQPGQTIALKIVRNAGGPNWVTVFVPLTVTK